MVLALLHSVTSFQAPLDDARVALAAANPFASFDGAKYSHLSAADFAERHRGGYKPRYPTPPVRSLLEPTRDSSFPPTRVDWRTKGAVSKVYDQDQCGCCWAMSATAAIEGQMVVKGHAASAPSLSWQQLICCDCGRGDQGCDGGDPHEAYDYIASAGGLESNKECNLSRA